MSRRVLCWQFAVSSVLCRSLGLIRMTYKRRPEQVMLLDWVQQRQIQKGSLVNGPASCAFSMIAGESGSRNLGSSKRSQPQGRK
jgi:hypothetical protein